MFITRGELGPENLGELKILAKYRQGEIRHLTGITKSLLTVRYQSVRIHSAGGRAS